MDSAQEVALAHPTLVLAPVSRLAELARELRYLRLRATGAHG
ncbi:MAG TPA: hypothetical protein VER33_19010 [Polyangiaceae bacterium]|nr:hypothetical protein [Polyangiaceae bacterium]